MDLYEINFKFLSVNRCSSGQITKSILCFQRMNKIIKNENFDLRNSIEHFQNAYKEPGKFLTTTKMMALGHLMIPHPKVDFDFSL